jgi:hypothetical protein
MKLGFRLTEIVVGIGKIRFELDGILQTTNGFLQVAQVVMARSCEIPKIIIYPHCNESLVTYPDCCEQWRSLDAA